MASEFWIGMGLTALGLCATIIAAIMKLPPRKVVTEELCQARRQGMEVLMETVIQRLSGLEKKVDEIFRILRESRVSPNGETKVQR